VSQSTSLKLTETPHSSMSTFLVDCRQTGRYGFLVAFHFTLVPRSLESGRSTQQE
jgi:hypothetical protein